MKIFFATLLVMAMVSIVGLLAAGLLAMARDDKARSNFFMRWRIKAQILAVIAFVLLVAVSRQAGL